MVSWCLVAGIVVLWVGVIYVAGLLLVVLVVLVGLCFKLFVMCGIVCVWCLG